MPMPRPNASIIMGHIDGESFRCTNSHAIDSTTIATLRPLKNKTFTPPTIKEGAGTAWRRPGPFCYATTLSVSI